MASLEAASVAVAEHTFKRSQVEALDVDEIKLDDLAASLASTSHHSETAALHNAQLKEPSQATTRSM